MAGSKVMNATDLMTRSVVSIRPDASVLDAARLMLYHKVSGLPVIEAGGTLVGIITEGDFMRRAEIGAERRRPPWIEFFTLRVGSRRNTFMPAGAKFMRS